MLSKRILVLMFVVVFLLVGCLPTVTPPITPPTPKGVIGGRIMAPPGPEITKDITGWIPLANATVTITDSGGVTHTVTTDEDGYYTFTDIAVDANTIITATGTVDGNTVIVKDVIPQAVAADEDYEAGIADAESTALALIVEELLKQGVDPGDIDLEGIQASDNFNEVVEQVNSILEGNGNVTTDPGLTNTVGNVVEDIISPPGPSPEPLPEPSPLPVNYAPIITSIPIETAIMGVKYIYGVEATDPDGDTLTYSLTTNPDGMAIDSSTGVISWIPTAVGAYDITVEASDGELSDSQGFTIIVSTVGITKIEVLPETMTLFEGESETIELVTATYEEVKGFEVPIPLGDCTYLSDNTNIATVSNDGKVTGVGEGTTTITVSYAGEEDTLEVTVNKPVHNIDKNEYYDTIQAAIDDASFDTVDTIKVAAGTYNEHVVIDKQLTLLGANADVNPVTGGRGPESIIDGTGLAGAGGLVYITGAADGIVFNGFTVTESFYSAGGIDIAPGSDNSVYENNIVSDNENTAFFILGDGNVIRNNVISDNRHSGEIGQINLQMDTNDNIIEDNAISGGGWIQIMLWNAFDGNIIQNNIITGIGLDGAKKPTMGIVLSDVGNNNIVRGNTINPEEGSIGFDRAINIAGARFGGFNTLVEDNIILNNVVGVKVGVEMDTTLVKGNDIQGNEYGIKIEKTAINTTIEENDLFINDVGIVIWEDAGPIAASTTHINQNNIVDNTDYGVLNKISTSVDATYNWWGSEYGPKHVGTNPGGLGNAVSDNVDYSNWNITP